MKLQMLSVILLLNLNAIALCDSCVVRPDHSKYTSFTIPVKGLFNDNTTYIITGLSIERQSSYGLRYGLDFITTTSLSNVRKETPLKLAVLPSVGIKYWEGKRIKIHQKTSVGVSNGPVTFYNLAHLDGYSFTRNVTRGIAATELVVSYRLGTNYRLRSPILSYTAGFATDIGLIPFLSETKSYSTSSTKNGEFSGFYTGISLGINLYAKRPCMTNF